MSHELCEKIGGLASRVNNAAVHSTGSESRQLLEIQDRFAKLQLVAIVKDLQAEHNDYKAAVKGLNEAIDFIGDATEKINNVAKAIKLTAKAAELVEKAIKSAAA
ncbi:MAG: hypothetical protein MRK01_04920 [Candidatus Scalindua sp.]|nr:hypothetical protein [Candidatus Scalindua sp.]